MPCPNYPTIQEIPSRTLLAIMPNMLEAPSYQHNAASQYTGSTNTQLTQYYKQ